MAKKQTAKPAPTDKSTTYSTRLNDEQRECLERAARREAVSASRFMRDATLRAAADVDNSVSPNDRAIAHLAKRLADLLANQKVHVRHDDEHEQSHKTTLLANGEWMPLAPVPSMFDDSQCPASAIKVETLNQQEIHQVMQIARACPIAFSKALLDALGGATAPTPKFVAKADPDKILHD